MGSAAFFPPVLLRGRLQAQSYFSDKSEMKPKDTVFFLTDVCVLRISRALEHSSENSREGCNAHYPITDALSCPAEI